MFTSPPHRSACWANRSDADRKLPSRWGFSLIELSLSLTVLTIGAGAVIGGLMTTRALGQANHERAVAMDGAVSALEEIKAAAFAEVFATFNDDTADDPGGVGTAPGASFEVKGLDLSAADPDGMAGRLEFPGQNSQLREDDTDSTLGMPRDLNGDGGIDASDHATDYNVLPVRVVVEWKGRSGDQQIAIVTTLADF